MDETLYTIVYLKFNLYDEKYDFEYVPYYLTSGSNRNNFVDKNENGFRNYDDKHILDSNCQFCVGEKYTLDELKEKYGDLTKNELLAKLFNEAKEKKHFAKMTDEGYEFTLSDDFSIGIKEVDDYKFSDVNIDKYSDLIVKSYNALKKKNDGNDVIVLDYKDYLNILEIDSSAEIFYYLKYKMNNIDSFFNSNERFIVIPLYALTHMLETLDFKNLKMYFKSKFDEIDFIDDDYESSYAYGDDEDFEESDDDDFKLILESLKEFVDYYKLIFDTVRSIQPFTKDNIPNVQENIVEVLDAISAFVIDVDDFVTFDDRLNGLLEFLDSSKGELAELIKMDTVEIQDEFLNFHNNFIRKLEEVLIEMDVDSNTIIEDNDKDTDKMDLSVEELNELIDNTLKRFDKLVGMGNVKQEILKLLSSVLFKLKLKDKIDFGKSSKHLVFSGNPGTGKTTVAELLAPVLHEIGYLDSSKVAKLAAQDLVAGYVGQTAIKTEKVIKKNKGGIIILDEAYILANGSDDGNDFGKEAIAVILKEMEKNDTMFVFCGYKKEMQEFLKMNSGLQSRISNFIDFKDYNVDELFQIFMNKLDSYSTSEYKLSITDDAVEVVKNIINKAVKKENFGNGRFIDNLFTAILNEHSVNTRYDTSMDRLLSFTIEDLNENMINSILGVTEEKHRIGFATAIENKVYEKNKLNRKF